MSGQRTHRSGSRLGGRNRPSRSRAALPVLRHFRHAAVQAWGCTLALVALLTLSVLSGYHNHPAFPLAQELAGASTQASPRQDHAAALPALKNTAQQDTRAPDTGGPDDDKACILCQAIQALAAVAPGGAPPLLGPGMVLADRAPLPVYGLPLSARSDGPQQPRAPPARA